MQITHFNKAKASITLPLTLNQLMGLQNQIRSDIGIVAAHSNS